MAFAAAIIVRMEVRDHTFLITGGASGLGAASPTVCRGGANVVAADLNRAAGEELVDVLQDRGRFVVVDVTKPQDVQSAIDMAQRQFGGLHGAVHCAGVLHAERVVGKQGAHDLDAFRRVIEINLIGTFNVIRLSAAAMAINQPERRRRAGRDRHDIVDRRLRRANRPGSLFGQQGRQWPA